MAWSDMAFEGVGSLLQNGASFLVARQKAKSDKQWQDWRNKIVRLSNAKNQNSITTNTQLALQRAALTQEAIRKSERLTYASTEVQAAATGTIGRSVNQTMAQVNRNAADARTRASMDLDQQLLGFQAQRESSNLQTVQQTEYSPIPMPTGASQLLNFGTDVAKLWQTYGKTTKKL